MKWDKMYSVENFSDIQELTLIHQNNQIEKSNHFQISFKNSLLPLYQIQARTQEIYNYQ